MQITSTTFKQNAKTALADAGLQKALAFSKPQFMARRTAAVANLPEFEQLRDIGRDIKNHTLANLDFYLEQFAANEGEDTHPQSKSFFAKVKEIFGSEAADDEAVG